MKIAIYNRAKKWLTIYDYRGLRLCRHYNVVSVARDNDYTDTVLTYAGKGGDMRITGCILIRDADCEGE